MPQNLLSKAEEAEILELQRDAAETWNSFVDCLRSLDREDRVLLVTILSERQRSQIGFPVETRLHPSRIAPSIRERIVAMVRNALIPKTLASRRLREADMSQVLAFSKLPISVRVLLDEADASQALASRTRSQLTLAPLDEAHVPRVLLFVDGERVELRDADMSKVREIVEAIAAELKADADSPLLVERRDADGSPRTSPEATKTPTADVDQTAQTSPIEFTTRADALARLVAEAPSAAEALVVEQIASLNLDSEWRDQLLFAVEELDFRDDTQRATLKERLFKLACQLRDSEEARSRQALWSAIRSFATFAPEKESVRLLEFLRDEDEPDTQRVAMLGVRRLFSAQPPSQPQIHIGLADRVFESADFFIRLRLLRLDDAAAMALEAFHALASLADPRVVTLAERIADTDCDWFRDLCQQRLQETIEKWQCRRDGELTGAVETLQQALAALDSQDSAIIASVGG